MSSLAELKIKINEMETSITSMASRLSPKIKITIFKKMDVYANKDIKYNRNYTFEEVVALAIKHKCHVIERQGEGQWYLKGEGIDFSTTKDEVLRRKDIYTEKYENIILYLLDY